MSQNETSPEGTEAASEASAGLVLELQKKKHPGRTGRPKGVVSKTCKETTRKNKIVLELAAKGLSSSEIGKVAGLPPSTVRDQLAKFKGTFKLLSKVEEYNVVRGKLFNAAELRMLQSLMSEKAIAKASLNNRAYAFKQIHDARRLEAGQSTANTAVLHRFTGDLPTLTTTD